jgi:photosystem II stability/assembly factor-like uncharacterized protein
MKKLSLFLFLYYLLYITHYSLSQWSVISNQGNEAVSFPSVNIGYSTTNGITKKTTNGGFNWSTLSGGNLSGIFFLNDLTGWVVGYPGYIGKTITGSTFTQQQTGISDRLNDVFFINENTGWVVGGDFSVERIFYTTNGGTNWTAQTSNTANKLFSVHFINENTGWSVGGPSSPKIIKTTNGGTNWFTQTTTAITSLYSVMFADENTGWAVAGYLGGETIIKTTNGGANWFSQSSGDTRYLRDCFVKNPNTMIAVGQGGKIITTTNGGNNWIVQSTGSSVELWSVDFPNDTVGYAIGDNVVLKTTNGGVTFISGLSNNIPGEFKLYQNYPNPFNPGTVIGYSLLKNSFVTLKIYDILGKEIAILVDEKLKSGKYEVTFDGSRLSSGIYFYKLVAGNFSETKKMLMIK